MYPFSKWMPGDGTITEAENEEVQFVDGDEGKTNENDDSTAGKQRHEVSSSKSQSELQVSAYRYR